MKQPTITVKHTLQRKAVVLHNFSNKPTTKMYKITFETPEQLRQMFRDSTPEQAIIEFRTQPAARPKYKKK